MFKIVREFAEGAVPSEFPLLEYGDNPNDQGPPVLFDEAAAEACQTYAAFIGREVNIDYEHQTIYPVTNGPIPSAGGARIAVVQTENGKPRLMASNVFWTNTATGLLERKEYRHYSAVILFKDPHEPRRATGIFSIGLVNDPSMLNQAPLIPFRAALFSNHPQSLLDALRQAGEAAMPGSRIHLEDIRDDSSVVYVVYCDDCEKLYRAPYTLNADGTVTLGALIEVPRVVDYPYPADQSADPLVAKGFKMPPLSEQDMTALDALVQTHAPGGTILHPMCALVQMADGSHCLCCYEFDASGALIASPGKEMMPIHLGGETAGSGDMEEMSAQVAAAQTAFKAEQDAFSAFKTQAAKDETATREAVLKLAVASNRMTPAEVGLYRTQPLSVVMTRLNAAPFSATTRAAAPAIAPTTPGSVVKDDVMAYSTAELKAIRAENPERYNEINRVRLLKAQDIGNRKHMR